MPERSFFVEPGAIQGNRATLRGQVVHQIRNVLRLRPGDDVELLNGSGYAYLARVLELSRDGATAEVLERRRPDTEPWIELELYQALPKGQKMEMILQKGTEIGVSRFIPVLSERCVSRPSPRDLQQRLARWSEIVREAAEQSGRAILPAISPLVDFDEACGQAGEADLAIMAWEKERAAGIRTLVRESVGARPHPRPLSHGERGEAPPSLAGKGAGRLGPNERLRVALLVGPEGGFSDVEASIARDAGVRTASLGPRILRAETAALVASTLVLSETGDLGG